MFIRKKRIGGREYYYLVANFKKNGKVRQKVIKYLGQRAKPLHEYNEWRTWKLIPKRYRKFYIESFPCIMNIEDAKKKLGEEMVGTYIRVFARLKKIFKHDDDETIHRYTVNWIKNRLEEKAKNSNTC